MSARDVSRVTAEEFNTICRAGVPLAEMMDIQVEALEFGYARLRLPWQAFCVRPGGVVSGPAIMALADTALWAVVFSTVGRVDMAVTSEMSIHFLRKAPAADVHAEGELLKLGRRLIVGTVKMWGEDPDKPVAHVTGTYALP
ncbi:MAG: PaaI family thioesterase [Ectothiorhodospiraceae bacterium]|nr:PaaI family thioesterase [Ectothiorhodospiraceae bacterium]MCH8503587.1 PaaI family thioesterase [Ectothiorhodospiraceae bacterium]